MKIWRSGDTNGAIFTYPILWKVLGTVWVGALSVVEVLLLREHATKPLEIAGALVLLISCFGYLQMMLFRIALLEDGLSFRGLRGANTFKTYEEVERVEITTGEKVQIYFSGWSSASRRERSRERVLDEISLSNLVVSVPLVASSGLSLLRQLSARSGREYRAAS